MNPAEKLESKLRDKTAKLAVVGLGYVGLPLAMEMVRSGFEVVGVDVSKVIDAAATKPFGFSPFLPGPGLGWHCIPVDPQYLSWKLRGMGLNSRFIELATEANRQMPKVVVQKVGEALNEAGKSIKGARILILGVSYKRDVGDLRESPALEILSLLQAKGAVLAYHDPYVSSLKINGETMRSTTLSAKHIARQDAVLLVTDHACLDIRSIAAAPSVEQEPLRTSFPPSAAPEASLELPLVVPAFNKVGHLGVNHGLSFGVPETHKSRL